MDLSANLLTHKDAAFSLFAGGAAINAVSKALQVTWYESKKLRTAYDEEYPSAIAADPGAEEPTEDGEEPTLWDVTLQVPASRATDMFATFTVAEQMEAIAHVLQRRMDEALAQDEDEV